MPGRRSFGTVVSFPGGNLERRADLGDWREVLDFEHSAELLRLSPSLKMQFIREDFQVSPTRYIQALLRAIDLPEALEYMPNLVAQLRRRRDQRRSLLARADEFPRPVRPHPRQRWITWPRPEMAG